MNPKENGFSAAKEVFAHGFNLFKKNPAVLYPFLIFLATETILLIFLYVIPRAPLVGIFGPLVSTFWGERFLHYPYNFILLPKLASLSRMMLSVLVGSFMTGIAVFIVYDVYNKKHARFKTSLAAASKKYIELFFLVFVFTLFFYITMKAVAVNLDRYFIAGHKQLLFLGPGLWTGLILAIINFLLAVFIQAAFTYAIPILLIEKRGIFRSISLSFVTFKKLFIPTLILVGLPMLIYEPVALLNSRTAFLMHRFFPEFILFVVFLGSAISSLIIDPIITVCTTLLYLSNKEKGK